jgi:hypothetical protein
MKNFDGRATGRKSSIKKINTLKIKIITSHTYFVEQTPVAAAVKKIVWSNVADPDPRSGAFLTPGIRNPGWKKNQDLRSGTNIPDHISKA